MLNPVLCMKTRCATTPCSMNHFLYTARMSKTRRAFLASGKCSPSLTVNIILHVSNALVMVLMLTSGFGSLKPLLGQAGQPLFAAG